MEKAGRINKILPFETVKELTADILLISKANVKTTVAEERQVARAYNTHREATNLKYIKYTDL